MTLRLVDSAWDTELTDALRADTSALRIICPFIKTGALYRLLALKPKALQVITRFNLADFAEGVSDIAALHKVLAAGGQVRGIKNLHAKMYLFGDTNAIVTSANLTGAGLDRNHEVGIVTHDPTNVASCRKYFDDLWARGGSDLVATQLDTWNEVVQRKRAFPSTPLRQNGLTDHGADAGLTESTTTRQPVRFMDAPQAFVKLMGEAHKRAALTHETLEECKLAGCHWALAYPKTKRPTGVKDGAAMFIALLTREPDDIRIFGRAIGLNYESGRDDATADDIALRPWKAIWPRYIRVHHAEFVAGTMANGVSLNELMETLGSDAFAATQRNANMGKGNVNPRRAYLQQAAVQLTDEGHAWVGERLQAAFDEHGTVSQDVLATLDWPAAP